MANQKPVQAESKVKFYVFQDERFVDLNLYQFGWEHCRPMYQFGPAVRNHFLFHYIISGKGKLETSGQTFFLSPGQGFLLCPGQISTYYADKQEPWEYTWVEFGGLRARECMTLAGLSEQQPIYTPRAGLNRVEKYMLGLVENHEKAPIRLIGLGMILLDELVQTSKTKIEIGNTCNGVTSADSASTLFAWDAIVDLTGPEGVRRVPIREFYIKEAMGYIDLNYSRDVSVEEIAAACGLNRSYFGKLFKETLGQSPQQYLIQYRMTKASELLKGTRIPVAEIGRSVGYENQLHFSRAFKNVFGISPSQYRARHFMHM